MYISIEEISKKFNISKRQVQYLCSQGRIDGAVLEKGQWKIPENVKRPLDKRKKNNNINQISLFDGIDIITNDEICKTLDISKATLNNWIRLKKIIPDVNNKYISKKNFKSFIEQLHSNKSKILKKRRNKKNISGNILYENYIQTTENKELVKEIIKSNNFNIEETIFIIANFAVQLYYERQGVIFDNNNVLDEFLLKNKKDKFYILIKDLIERVDYSMVNFFKIRSILNKHIKFVYGEDSLGFIYISLKDLGNRKTNGTYYTPAIIVNEIIENIEIKKNNKKLIKFLDPCCGTGNFINILFNKYGDEIEIYGQDIDPISVYIARINLFLLDVNISIDKLKSNIRIGNYLLEKTNEKYDVIFGNPPWGGNIKPKEELIYKELYLTAKSKSIETYNLFVERSLKLLKDNGILFFVLPESILTVKSHEKIRKIIIDNCSFKYVSYKGNVFNGVQCPSILLKLSKDIEKTVLGCVVNKNTEKFEIKKERLLDPYCFSFNISDDDYECIQEIENIKNSVFLKDNAIFALGIVTGDNSKYLSNNKQLGYEPILKGSDIKKYSITSVRNFIKYSPELFQQVAPTEIYRANEKLLYRFISEVPVFAYDNKKTLSLNSCNILIPKIPDLSIKYILAILNSTVVTYWLLKKFKSIKLLKSHIEQIPIPYVSKAIQSKIEEKVDNIINSNNPMDIYFNLDKDIMDIYNISNKNRAIIYDEIKNKNLFI